MRAGSGNRDLKSLNATRVYLAGYPVNKQGRASMNTLARQDPPKKQPGQGCGPRRIDGAALDMRGPTEKFDSVDDLILQMADDVGRARAVLTSPLG